VEAALAPVLLVVMANWVARPGPGGPEARVRRPPLVGPRALEEIFRA